MHKIWAEHGAEHVKNKHNAAIDAFKKLKAIVKDKKDYNLKGILDIYEENRKKPKPTLDTLKHLDDLVDVFFKLDGEEMFGTFDKFMKEYKLMLMKVKWLRMGFLCSLCEMHNHVHINTDIHTITYHDNFCKHIVKNFLDIIAKKYLSYMRMVMVLDEFIFLITDRRIIKKDLDRYMIRRNILIVDKCAKNPFKEGECYDMCLQFNLNRFTDLFDGESEVLKDFADDFPDYKDYLIGVDSDFKKLVEMGKNHWTEKKIKNLRKTDSLMDKKIKKDKTLKPKKKNSFGLQFKTPKIVSFIERHHVLNPLQIENLDDQLDPLVLHKLADNPIDISRFITHFDKKTGIDLFRDSKKLHLHYEKEKLLAMIHAKDTNIGKLSEVLDGQLQKMLEGIIMTDYKSFLGDTRLEFIKLGKPKPSEFKGGSKAGKKASRAQAKPASNQYSASASKSVPRLTSLCYTLALTTLYTILF